MTRTAFYSYTVLSVNQRKSNYQIAVDALMNQITAQLFYLNYAKSFYIYILASRSFRSAYVQTIIRLYQRLRRVRTE